MKDGLEVASGRPVSRETLEKLQRYDRLLREEASRQNLVSAATLDDLWNRHILDSAQLVRFEAHAGASWVDIGSGGGLPGVVIACLVEGPVTMIEQRRLRAEFLRRVVDELSLNAEVVQKKAESVDGRFDMVTGRAVAGLSSFLDLSNHLSTRKTRFVLPKGRSAESELAETKETWQGSFHVERSVTDVDSYIVVAEQVRARHGDQNRGRKSEGRRR